MTKVLERFRNMSVLVVDDNHSNVDLVINLLQREGLSRITGETDSRCVEALLATVNPDLVLLDLNMPHIDGYAVLEKIIQFAAGIYLPVLVLTADVTSVARDRALANGARDFLVKPLDLTEVVLRVANLLETRELYANLRRFNGANDSALRHATLSRTEIESILSGRRINPVYQPVVHVNDMTTIGYEALARFPQPHLRGPAGWFADAAAVGLGVELELLAVEKALGFLSQSPPQTFLALNMSPATIMSAPFQDLCSNELCPQIVIELTEHVPIEDYAILHHALRHIRDQGARLAVDDLGSGYAGFSHLVAMEPDIIKLDISLVSGIDTSRNARALVGALVSFAAESGAVIIAEGVEDVHELEALQEVGVPWAQGFYLGRPEPSPFEGSSDATRSAGDEHSSEVMSKMREPVDCSSDQDATT